MNSIGKLTPAPMVYEIQYTENILKQFSSLSEAQLYCHVRISISQLMFLR